MESYTLIVVGDERAPMRRFQVPRARIRDAIGAAVAVAVVLVGTAVHYGVTLRENRLLADYRVEATEQREQIQIFEQTLVGLQQEIDRVREFERKVRIIANLPGSAATGGVHVTELATPTHAGAGLRPDLIPAGEAPLLPSAVSAGQAGQGGSEREISIDELVTPGAQQLRKLDDVALQLETGAQLQAATLTDLLDELQEKHNHLTSMPSIWPARGWLTSRFGKRISPFTGKPQSHSGIDIAAEEGTPVAAPARGRVSYVGRKGPLGNAVVVDHGYGVRTLYGHNAEIHVKIGEEVERGQLLASVGNTGRSTGPHLHYSVEVKGEPQNPLDYIFD